MPLSVRADGVRIAVRLNPRAARDRLDGVARLADGRAVLRVSVTAPAAGQRANEALLHLLAKEWDLARRDLAIVAGGKSRNKIVHVAGVPGPLRNRLAAALSALPRW